MFRIMVLMFLLLPSLHVIDGQTDASQGPRAYVFAEFGVLVAKERTKKVVSFHDALKRWDGAQGVIINYGTAQAISTRRDLIVKDWLGCDRFNGVRLTWVDGPAEPKIRTVFWIVPVGADFPKP